MVDLCNLGGESMDEINVKYYYISIVDKNEIIIPEPEQGYFTLISDIFGAKQFLTYRSVVVNYEMYLKKAIEIILDTLEEREREIIKKYYGIDDNKARTLEDISNDYNLSREGVRQIKGRALRKLRHPTRSRKLKTVFYSNDQEIQDEPEPIDYGSIFETIIKGEITLYNNNKEIDLDKILFGKIITSPRFSSESIFYGSCSITNAGLSLRTTSVLKRAGVETIDDLKKVLKGEITVRNLGRKSLEEIIGIVKRIDDSIQYIQTDPYNSSVDELELSPQTYYYVRKAGIKTIRDLAALTPEDFAKIEIRRRCLEEVLEKIKRFENRINTDKCGLIIKKYNIDGNTLFIQPGERPITRTKLSASEKLKLLQMGMIYVSDFLDYYNLFCISDNDSSDTPSIIYDSWTELNILKRYSAPMLRIRISKRLQEKMNELDIRTLKDLVEKMEMIPKWLVSEVYEIIENIKETADAYGFDYVI